jgi:8-oxo-dGTP pyrophosphatase MutT (NUDIX family)
VVRRSPILRFHAIGQWAVDQFHIARIPSTWSARPEVEQLIDLAWQAAAARPGVHLFDGPMCRLESWSATPERLSVVLSDTSYKKFLGTNLTNPDLMDRFGKAVLANPVGVSPALLTVDGFLMMGKRNASVAYYPNRVHPFAGALDPADANPFDAIRRELAEELGFTDADVTDIHCTGIAEDLGIRQPELIFLVRSTRTKQQIESALDRTEHDDTWSIPANSEQVAKIFDNDDPASSEQFTPVALASLLLFGRIAFGQEFFDQAASRFI